MRHLLLPAYSQILFSQYAIHATSLVYKPVPLQQPAENSAVRTIWHSAHFFCERKVCFFLKENAPINCTVKVNNPNVYPNRNVCRILLRTRKMFLLPRFSSLTLGSTIFAKKKQICLPILNSDDYIALAYYLYCIFTVV